MEHFITEVRVNEVRHLKNITIKLNPERRQHLILNGKNGSGKTSVLLAMKNYLQAINDGMLNTINIDYPKSVEYNQKRYNRAKNDGERIQAQRAVETFISSIDRYSQSLTIAFSSAAELDLLYKSGDFIT